MWLQISTKTCEAMKEQQVVEAREAEEFPAMSEDTIWATTISCCVID